MLGGVLGGGGERAWTLLLGCWLGKVGCDNNRSAAQLLLGLRWWLAAKPALVQQQLVLTSPCNPSCPGYGRVYRGTWRGARVAVKGVRKQGCLHYMLTSDTGACNGQVALCSAATWLTIHLP